MANAFGDQFLKAGLVNKAELNKAEKSKNKQQQLVHKQKVEVVDEVAVAARQAAAEKATRDRELNLQKKAVDERKALHAQVRQLITSNRLPRDGGEVGYNFQEGTAIRRIFVSQEMRDKLARGLLDIAKLDHGYEVIPAAVAEKIKLRDASYIVSGAAIQPQADVDDAYANYPIPDDLMW